MRYKGIARSGILPGFVVAPFDLKDKIYSITELVECGIDDIEDIIHKTQVNDGNYPFPNSSTARSEHIRVVESIKEILNGDCKKKIIASKVILKSGCVDIMSSLDTIGKAFPDAFVFMFYLPQAGLWLGASPELLLSCKNNMLSTFALAGTRIANSEEEWDEKNLKEHEIVKNYIVDTFRSLGFSVKVSDTVNRKAGNIEHLLTEINSYNDASNNVETILRVLSPTPALAGYPKEDAIKEIHKLERWPRGFYGGFIGPYNSSDDFSFFVNLRSIRIGSGCYCMHVGGGITSLSDAETEWIETENKAKTILDNIVIFK